MTETGTPDLHLYLLVGEPSGDLLGARLMAALKAETGQRIRFSGVGGPAMIKQGLEPCIAMESFSVMGLVEVLPHIRRIRGHVLDLVARIARDRPDALVTIDSPAFTLAVAKRLKGKGIPLIHYVAPSVWAWKPWRAKAVAGYLDKLLTLLPFEPPLFQRHGLDTVFVGHPAVETAPGDLDRMGARRGLGLEEEALLFCLLPGSRRGEIARMAPVFLDVAAALKKAYPAMRLVLPTLPHLEPLLRDAIAATSLEAEIVSTPEARESALRGADLALAASGTVVVELAARGVPCLVAHRVNWLSGWLVRLLFKIDTVSLPNIVLGEKVVPEFLQERCRTDLIVPALRAILEDRATATHQRAAFQRFVAALRDGDTPPSLKAAREVLATVQSDDRKRSP